MASGKNIYTDVIVEIVKISACDVIKTSSNIPDEEGGLWGPDI